MAKKVKLAFALMCVCAASQAHAAEPACEFHVWTSQGVSAGAHGAISGSAPFFPAGTISGLTGDFEDQPGQAFVAADPEEEDSPLSPERQLELLGSLQIAETFGLNGYVVTLHSDAVDSVTLRRKAQRLSTSASPCYAELVLQDVTYSLELGRDDKLKTLFFFRKFGPEGAIERRFSTFTQQKLEITPRKKNFDKTAWEAAVKDAYVKNIAEFAAALEK